LFSPEPVSQMPTVGRASAWQLQPIDSMQDRHRESALFRSPLLTVFRASYFGALSLMRLSSFGVEARARGARREGAVGDAGILLPLT
jgi:hypothetical protein